MLNRQLFAQAKSAYDSGDFAEALRGYYVCLKEQDGPFEPGEAGLIYHMLGNCLVKMRSFPDAAKAYQKALIDVDYENLTAVHSNYGLALTSQGKYQDAIEQFEAVLKDPSYETPFKAYNGLGNAYMKLGDFAAAGTAYRNAAVDERNPAPVKALLNLGVCFMGLGRPQDALDTYNAIFEFDPDQNTLNKTYSNMGQAYVALNRMPEALEAFENALRDERFVLSDSAKIDFEKARNWRPDADDSGLFMMANDALAEDYNAAPMMPEQSAYMVPVAMQQPMQQAPTQVMQQPMQQAPTQIAPAVAAAPEIYGAGVPDADQTGFFNSQDVGEQFIDIDGAMPKKHKGLRVILIIFIVILLAVIAAAVLFWRGYGYPTQQQVAQKLFTAHAAGEDVSEYWISTENQGDIAAINKIMLSVAETDDITVDYLERGMLDSTMTVTANLDGGGKVRYEISMTRDFSSIEGMISWRINGIEFAFPSTQNSMSTSTMTSSDGVDTSGEGDTTDADVAGTADSNAASSDDAAAAE